MPTLMRLIALVLLVALPHFASAYPTRSVRMIIPFPPGGASDCGGRAVAQPLSEMWGQNVVSDNRGGKKPGRRLHAADGRNAGVIIAPNVYTFVIATLAGFANVDQNMVRYKRSLIAREWQTFVSGLMLYEVVAPAEWFANRTYGVPRG